MKQLKIIAGSILLFSSFLVAGGYPSFHQQVSNTKGLLSQIKKLMNSSNGLLEQSIYLTIHDDAKQFNNTWCGNNFQRVKIYIPAGLKKISVIAVARPNSSFYILKQFIPSNEKIIKNINWLQVDNNTLLTPMLTDVVNVGTIFTWKPGYEKYYKDIDKFEGGWLYLQIIQASNFVYSQFGHINSPSLQVAVKYYYDPQYQNELMNWLKNTKFDPKTGDPIDGFSSITEEVRYCSDFGKKEYIYGIPDSDVTGYELLYGIKRDPSLPSFTFNSNSTSSSLGDEIVYDAKVTAGKQNLEGIQVEVNQNTTTGILLQEHLNSSCLAFTSATISDQNIGQLIYSDNGQNWYDNVLDDAIKDNIRYVGYLINAPLAASRSAQLSVKAKIDPACESSNIQVDAKLQYSLNDVPKTETKRSLLSLQVDSGDTNSGGTSGGGSYTPPSYTPPSGGTGGSGTTSGGKSQAQIYCENHGGTWADGTCLSRGGSGGGTFFYSSSKSSKSSVTNSGGKSQAQIYCENHGGTWADGTCLSRGGDTGTVSSTSSMTPSNGNKSQAQIYCENHGGQWIDGTCVARSENESESSSSSSLQSQNKIVQVVRKLAEKEYPIEGYFAQYGKGPFDWIYLSKNGELYKLEGMNPETGELQWTPLSSYFSEVKFEDGNLTMGSRTITRDIDVRVSSVLKALEENQPFEVAGYFVHYDNGAYDWVLKTKDGLYKLEGLNDTGTFDWTPLRDYFKKIDLKDYTKLIIGDAEIEAVSSSSVQSSSTSEDPYMKVARENCQNIHGQWDEEKLICIVGQRDSESHTSNSNSFQQQSSFIDSGDTTTESGTSSSSNVFPSIVQ